MVGDEEEEMPFPAMTTDSRHIILVHATSEGSAQMKLGYGDKDKEETGEDSADAANGNRCVTSREQFRSLCPLLDMEAI